MATPDLSNEVKTLNFGLDSVVIRNFVNGIKGGRTLDLTGFSTTDTVIKAGHVIIYDTVNEVYKPMPLSGTAYGSLPANHVYAGVLYKSVLKDQPFASIMNIGSVNIKAVPFAMDSILSAFKAAVPTIVWEND